MAGSGTRRSFGRFGNTMSISKPVVILLLLVIAQVNAEFRVSVKDLTIRHGNKNKFTLYTTELPRPEDVEISFQAQHPNVVTIEPEKFIARKNESEWHITVFGYNAGFTTINTNISNTEKSDFSEAFVRVTVEKSETLFHISTVVGWIYFCAWSISFYPQIYSNYKRKSVVGLNFDFLSLNIVGFVMYSLFNCGLFWVPEIEQEYFARNPKGLNPVKVNDIFFSLHASFATMITIIQCFVYEAGTQRVSTIARIIHGIFATFIVISLILSSVHIVSWLDFLYYCSYIKLAITLIKYVPQAFYNYKRQSTIGWSIGNIFLDFTGGILSMLQMILDAYNYDDWDSIFGDPTKFGLGLFSVAFDIFFLIQHYVLYRATNEKVIDLNGHV